VRRPGGARGGRRAPNDRDHAEPVGDAVRRYLEASGLADRLEQASVLEAWSDLVGPAVAGATTPLSVAADGTLFVAVRTSAWMSELSLLEREILARINGRSERGRIARIRWQLAR
jgi:predicted nucleic acid-binding Zn ribbon protein